MAVVVQVEQYVDDLKHGRSDEARLVDQLSHRVRSKSSPRPLCCLPCVLRFLFQKYTHAHLHTASL